MTRLLVFIGVALGIVASIHYYLSVRLLKHTHLPVPLNRVATLCLVFVAATLPVVLILGRRHPEIARLLVWPAYVWMGLMFLLFVALLGADIVKLGAWMVRQARQTSSVDPERRTFLARMAA